MPNQVKHTAKTNNSVEPLSAAVDRRRHGRTSFPVRVQIISHGALGDRSYDGVCTDISQEGVAFETEGELFLQGMVELVFEINNKESRVSARLLYRVGQRYGAYLVKPQ